MKTYFIILSIFTTWLVSSCYQDKGNYAYTEISQVTVTGLAPSYTCMAMQDVLHLAPGITSDQPGETFSCLWTVGNNPYPASAVDTIGTENELDYPVNLRPGSYTIILRVTNMTNGHATFYTTSLYVLTQFSLGYYVLKDMGDYTELDLHLPDGNIAPDLLEKSTGRRLNGKPRSLGIAFTYYYINPETMTYGMATPLNICTERDAWVMRMEDMGLIYTHNELFLGEVPDDIPYYMTHHGLGLAYMSSKGVYSYMLIGVGSGKFGFPVDVQGGCSPNVNSLVMAPTLFFFDDAHHRFLSLGNTGRLSTFDNNGPGGESMPFAANDIPHELLYFGHSFTGQQVHEGFAIFEENAPSKQRYLYRLLLDELTHHNPITSVTSIDPSLKFSQATYFATNELDASLIYFLHDNQLYAYDVRMGTEELLSPAGIGSGEEITYVSNRYYVNPDDAEANFNYLVVGTHQSGKYKLYLYEMLGGKPYGAVKRIMEGNGKVTKMQYTTNKFSVDQNFIPSTNNYIPLSI
jgi:hypothetical protein